MNELNPNHPVTREVHDHWYKIAALLVARSGGSVVIPPHEVEALQDKAITIRFSAHEGIVLKLVSMEEGERMATQAGGLPH